MDYVTEQGVKLRTGYHNIKDWYFLTVKEMLDNAIDFLWKYYPGSTNAQVRVRLDIDKDNQLFTCTVSNTNYNNIPVFQHLDKILSFDMRYGSKQNEFIISRGMLGDAMKQLATFSYVLMNASLGGDEEAEKADASAFTSKQWDIPLRIKANGITREIKIHVDKPAQEIKPDIVQVDTTTSTDSSSTDTEISVTMPLLEGRLNNLSELEKYCRRYIAFTTDIAFTLEIPSLNVKIEVPALHSLPVKWNNTSSIHSYTPQEFIAKIMGVHDKEQYTIYDVLRTFKECTRLKKTPELEMTIAEFMHTELRAEKTESLYYQLKEKLYPPQKLSLPHSHISDKERMQALSRRIDDLYGSGLGSEGQVFDYLEPDKAVYKIVDGNVSKPQQHEGDEVSFPFAFEIIAVPFHEDLIRCNKKGYETEFYGAVNYSVSPNGNDFNGKYEWKVQDKKKIKRSEPLEERRANGITEVLHNFGFQFYRYLK